jgi:hypothetical protein
MTFESQNDFMEILDQLNLINPNGDNYNDLKDFLELEEKEFEALVYSMQKAGLIIETRPGKFILI